MKKKNATSKGRRWIAKRCSIAASCFLIFILSGCHTGQRATSMLHFDRQGKEIVFKNPALVKVQSGALGKDNLISLLDNRAGKLYLYDYKLGRMIDSLDIKLRPSQFLFNYQWISRDRVLLAINSNYLGDMHDSAVCIVNRDKKVLQTFSYAGTGVPLYDKENPKGYRKSAWSYEIHTNFPIRLSQDDSSLVTTLAPFISLHCSDLEKRRDTFAYKISGKSKASARALASKVPECSPWWNADNEIITAPYGDFLPNGEPVFGFSHSASLLTTKESVEPSLELYKSLTEGQKLQYKRLIYDKFRRCFWWTIEIEAKPVTGARQVFNYYLVRLDEQFEVVSEGFFPKGLTQYIIPIREGLLVKDQDESDKSGNAVYTIVTPGSDTLNPEILRKELADRTTQKAEDIDGLVKSIAPGASEVILLSLDRLPPGFTKVVMDKLSDGKGYPPGTIHIFTADSSKVPVSVRRFASLHRNNVLKEYANDFTWPVKLQRDPATGNFVRREYPSPQIDLLLLELEGMKMR